MFSETQHNIEKFTDKAVGYAKFRPPYARAFYDYLFTKIDVSAKTIIADIGAGTGLFSKGLLDRGCKVVCIEPNVAMRIELENYLGGMSGYKIVDGTAEDTRLPNDSCDMITVAQAFHWFDRERFLIEAARILKPYGKLALVWNMQDTDIPMFRELAEINRRHCPEFVGFSGGVDYKNPNEFDKVFLPGSVEYKVFNNDIFLTKEQFMGRLLSASFVPVVNTTEYKTYYNAISDLFIRHSVAGNITVPLKTVSYVGLIR